MLTKIPFSSPVSFFTAANLSSGTNPDSPSSSSQYSLSSNSCSDPSILLMKSALDLARDASRYCAPTDVPERNNCLPRIWTSVLLGSSENSLIMPSAYSFVLSLRSLSPMVGRLHPLSFILYPFKPHRVRDACPAKTCLSPFLPELPRFEN